MKMNTKKLGILALLTVLVIGVVLISGCVGPEAKTGPGGITVPSGFTKLPLIEHEYEGVTITQYMGSGTVADAASSFKAAFRAAGWTFMGEGVVAAGYTGTGFEKGNEIAVIYTIQAGDQVTVMVIIGPKEVEEAPEEERKEVTPEEVGPPTSDVPGEDIPDVPRYPGSVRTDYLSVGGMTEVSYITSASFDEVVDFYEEKLPANGWDIIISGLQIDEEEQRFWSLVASKGDKSLSMGCELHGEYPDYTSVFIGVVE